MTTAVMLTFISPVVAIAIAVWGFRRSTRADKLRAFFEVQDRYLANDTRSGRRIIHQWVAGRSVEEIAVLDQAILSGAGYALAVMNSIAIAFEGGYVEKRLVTRSMGRSFATAVTDARPYIDYVEKIRGFRPYPFAERLAAELATADTGFSARRAVGDPLGGIPNANEARDDS